MTADPTPVWSGHCGIGRHPACRGLYSGHPCPCPCHQEPQADPEPEPPPPGPYLRLSRAALALDGGQDVPEAARRHLSALFRTEAAHAADRGDGYPPDRAPLLELADLIVKGTT